MSNKQLTEDDDGGMAIVRVKPLGAGGGGVEISGKGMKDGQAALRYQSAAEVGSGGGGRIDIVSGSKCTGKSFSYMNHVIPPETDNEALYNFFLPRRIEAFMSGYNVNVLAYGQTGTGTGRVAGRSGRVGGLGGRLTAYD